MSVFHENDVVRLLKAVKADIIWGGEVSLPEGTIGTIVIIHGDYVNPAAFEVEFFIPEHNDFALATVCVGAVSEI
jgi:hypothetical protein